MRRNGHYNWLISTRADDVNVMYWWITMDFQCHHGRQLTHEVFISQHEGHCVREELGIRSDVEATVLVDFCWLGEETPLAEFSYLIHRLNLIGIHVHCIQTVLQCVNSAIRRRQHDRVPSPDIGNPIRYQLNLSAATQAHLYVDHIVIS